MLESVDLCLQEEVVREGDVKHIHVHADVTLAFTTTIFCFFFIIIIINLILVLTRHFILTPFRVVMIGGGEKGGWNVFYTANKCLNTIRVTCLSIKVNGKGS